MFPVRMADNASPNVAFYGKFLLFMAGMGGLLFGIDAGIIAAALLDLEKTVTLKIEQMSFMLAAVLWLAFWLTRSTARR